MDKKRDSHILYYGLAVLVFVAVSMIGVSFAYWSVNLQQTAENVITTGCLNVTKSSETGVINLPNAIPITDEAGKASTPLAVTVKNNCASQVSYQVNLDILTGTDFPLTSVKYQFGSGSTAILNNAENATPYTGYGDGITATSSKKVGTGTIAASGQATINLRLWVDANTPLTSSTQNKTFKGKLVIVATPS